ncbi:MAG: transglutaminase family protein [Verrucomicrobiota bacterium]
MLIKIGFDISLNIDVETTVLYCLRVHPSRHNDLCYGESFRIEHGGNNNEEYWDTFGNWCGRLRCRAGVLRFVNQAVVRDSGLIDPRPVQAHQHDVWELPQEILRFLLPSRYCETDSELLAFAWANFNTTPLGIPRVEAICDFVNSHIKFDYMQARANRTALEAYRERIGVCRDFTHLAVTLCRCMNIPARYVTGYLGDIGVPAVPDPMDFSAWMEVYLGGEWHTFDPRHNTRRIGRVVIARGRDASDVAITTVFGNHQLVNFSVFTEEVFDVNA